MSQCPFERPAYSTQNVPLRRRESDCASMWEIMYNDIGKLPTVSSDLELHLLFLPTKVNDRRHISIRKQTVGDIVKLPYIFFQDIHVGYGDPFPILESGLGSLCL